MKEVNEKKTDQIFLKGVGIVITNNGRSPPTQLLYCFGLMNTAKKISLK